MRQLVVCDVISPLITIMAIVSQQYIQLKTLINDLVSEHDFCQESRRTKMNLLNQ